MEIFFEQIYYTGYKILTKLEKPFLNPVLSNWFEEICQKIWNIKNHEKIIKLNSKLSSKLTFLNRKIDEIDCSVKIEQFYEQVGKILIYVFEKNRSKQKSQQLGQTFTPFKIVNKIVDTIFNEFKVKEKPKIVDFASGTGNFIVNILMRYLIIFKSKDAKFKIKYLEIIKDHLLAIDIDKSSTFATFVYSTLVGLHFLIHENIKISRKILNFFPIMSIYQKNFIGTDKKHSNFSPDIIVGNPPYIFLRDLTENTKEIIKKKKYKTARGQYDISDIFIEQSIDNLGENGVLGVIIPETILFLDNRKYIREIIVTNCSKIKIIHVKNTFNNVSVENILLFLQKSSEKSNKTIEISINNSKSEILKKYEILNKNNVPFVLPKINERKILNYIQKKYNSINQWNKKHKHKHNQIKVFRGVEISKKGKIMQCPACNKWLPFSKNRKNCSFCNFKFKFKFKFNKPLKQRVIIHQKNISTPGKTHVKIPFIKTISKNSINGPNENKFLAEPDSTIETGLSGINYKDLQNYRHKRIIVRQILADKKICAAIAPKNALTSQSIYNIILPTELNLKMEILAKNLNSDLISYYNYITFSRGKRLFSRILMNKLKDLPFIPNNFNDKELCNIPRELEILVKKNLYGKNM